MRPIPLFTSGIVTLTPLSSNSPLADKQASTQQPDILGRFGQFGGKYVPETLMPALSELESAYQQYRNELGFQEELQELLRDYVGRKTPLYFAERLTAHYARLDGTGAQIYLKRET
jgi:tryptophan synthase beta chain